MDTELSFVEKMLQDEQTKATGLQSQLGKLEETMERLKADYIKQHNQLMNELVKTTGSIEALNKVHQHDQKEKSRTGVDGSDTGSV